MKSTYYLLLVFLLLACSTKEDIEPQNPLSSDNDELQAILASDAGSQLKKQVLWRIYKLNKQENPQEGMKALNDLQEIASREGDQFYFAKANHGLGLLMKRQGDYIEAIDHYLQAVNSFDKIDSSLYVADDLNNIGNIFAESGNFDYAIRFFEKAQQIYHIAEDIEYLTMANLNLAICSYSKTEPNYERADEYFQEALALANELTEERNAYLNWIYNSIGAMHYKRGNYGYAKTFYLKSLDHLEPSADLTQKKFIAFFNIGEAAIGADNLTDANKYIEQAIDLLKDGKVDSNSILGARNIEAALFQKKGNYEKATSILENALDIANKEAINPKLKETLKLLSHSYRNLNNSGKAVDASRYDRILALKESQEVFEKELVEKTNFKALQAALSLKIELDNQIKEKKAEMDKKSFYINLTLVLAVLLIAVAIYLSYRVRKAYAKYINFRHQVKADMKEAVNVVENWSELGEEEKMRLLNEVRFR
ncbi:tetratricopeptide repeat protein [Fulvivirga sp. 29W222]|uniref:Tetratricopeptide repeat protein n=1 Tax=Fulvivirga marina TaxID=2494733 RepID=A0A937KEV4_9BACT|nr:tetratricopeptide repeat protein [Fulvivirga marina]MBL6447590.1 tetratricopeptide repeat protein [Fulvivirga marina]